MIVLSYALSDSLQISVVMHSPADHSQFYMPRENTDGAESTRKLFPVRRYNRRSASCKSLFASIPSVTGCMQTRVEPHVNDSSKLQRFPKVSVCSRVQLTKGASGRCASDCPRNEFSICQWPINFYEPYHCSFLSPEFRQPGTAPLTLLFSMFQPHAHGA